MKIIFLDIDGVLNNAIDSEHHQFHKEGYYFFSKERVGHLNYILGQTGAKIVVSSTWRLGKTVSELQALCKWMGIEGEVIDKTEYLKDNYTLRGNEIYKWIEDNEDLLGKRGYDFLEYVILDDESDMLLWLKDHFVNCDGEIGLTHSNAYQAVKILNRPPANTNGITMDFGKGE